MKVLILGSNGYLGNVLMNHLEKKGYEVCGCDNDFREYKIESLTPIKRHSKSFFCDVRDYTNLKRLIDKFCPNTIVHLAEIPSAPYSMKNQEQSIETQEVNILGSLNVLWAIKEIDPTIHLVKLGTAGEYPDWLYPKEIQIPEDARITVKRKGKDWIIPTPRYAGSFYHMSKLHDSFNCDYANRIWGIDITDINQAPVYGYVEGTRFDYDEEFGTVINRFVTQALVNHPLTVYGKGGQTRSYIHIQNSMEAIELVIKNRPKGYKTIHQLTETKTINEIAELIKKHTGCKIKNIPNPRNEKDYNEFDFEMKQLKEWGLKPIFMENKIQELIDQIKPYKNKIKKSLIMPKIKWK